MDLILIVDIERKVADPADTALGLRPGQCTVSPVEGDKIDAKR